MSERSPVGRLLRAVVVGLVVTVGAAVLAPSAAGAAPVRYPWAILESLRVDGNQLVASGYAFDPDTAAPIDVLMAVDAVNTKLALTSARGFRPDVGAFWGRPFSGFSLRSAPLAPGPHLMCIAARNVGAGEEWRLFGCRYFRVGPADPIGSLDTAVSVGDQATVSGWALDLDTAASLTVRVRVDGVTRTQVIADRLRYDLLRTYPLNGARHGFAATVPISPGPHTICAVAVNRGTGHDRTVACRSVTGYPVDPTGSFDSLTMTGGTVRARGWAHDPDAAGPSTVRIGIKTSPLRDATVVTTTASLPRSDIALFGLPRDRGFDLTLPIDQPGPATVCISVDNRNRGSDRLLGCRTLAVTDRRPLGVLTDLIPTAGGVQVKGTMTDPDGGPVVVEVAVDGVVRRTVDAAPGFDLTVDGLAAGSHSVCVTGRDVVSGAAGLRGDTEVPCGGAVLGPGRSYATTGTPAVLGRVGPVVGHPIEKVDRDAGLSVGLHDGSTLWLFGDSTERDAGGTLRYFVSGTAAWASAGSPRTTTDAVDAAGAPFTFATPTAAWADPCPSTAPERVLWPISAVGVPEATRTRVVIFLENVCLGSGAPLGGGSRGITVAEWIYDPVVAPPAGRPVQATVLENRVRDQRTYGMASTLGPDGLIYAFSCTTPPGGGWPTEYGPCFASRVDPDAAHVRSAYRYWDGGPVGASGSWVSDESAAAPLDLPDQVFPSGELVPVNPVASFTVRHDPAFGAWVMAYSPWPGFTDEVVVRFADAPTGPWTAPLSIRLPGCDDSSGGKGRFCYAGTAQPRFSSADRIGFGYYDQLVAVGPDRGEYRVGTIRVWRTP